MAKFAVILPAAGKSTRFGDRNYKKTFIPLNNKPVWLHSAEQFLNRADVVQTLVVIDPDDREYFHMKFGANIAILGIQVVDGGAERSDSVKNALAQVSDLADHVVIHDAARPCLAKKWIDAVFSAGVQSGAATLAVPVTSTLKRSADGRTIDATVSRDHLWEAQTPQVFRRDVLQNAFANPAIAHVTDDAQLVEASGHPVTLVPGSQLNLKITRREDLTIAAAALKALPKPKLGSGPKSSNPLDDMWR